MDARYSMGFDSTAAANFRLTQFQPPQLHLARKAGSVHKVL